MQGMFKRIPAMALALVLMQPAILQAQEKRVPETQGEVQASFAPLVKKTAGAVVNVYAERQVQQRVSTGDPFFDQFFGQRLPNRTAKQSSLGSGVIVDAKGLVVTNNHVIEGADDIKVALADGREFSSKVLLKDARLDLAVLKIEAKDNFTALPISDSDVVEVGDLVLAIGNPFGVGQTVTSGIVSALARNQVAQGDFGFFIQTDAAINPGNSGGALMNIKGELIGINTAIFTRGGGSNGVGFAIPANLVKVFLAAAESGQKSFERPYIGATFEPVTSDIADALGLDKVRGALVLKIVQGGPAAAAGLKPGEVVTAVNGIPVEHPDALGYRLTTAGLGGSARLSVQSGGKEREVTIKLDTAPETVPREQSEIVGHSPFTGMTVGNLSPRLAGELTLPVEKTGVAVMAIKDGTPAARLGFQAKDIIISINGSPVTSVKVMQGLIDDDPSVWRIEIERDGQRLTQFFR